MGTTKAQTLREIHRVMGNLSGALRKNAPVQICAESGNLAATAELAWPVPDVWTPELIDRALALLRQAAIQTKGTASHAEIAPRMREFQLRLTSLLVAKEAVSQDEGD